MKLGFTFLLVVGFSISVFAAETKVARKKVRSKAKPIPKVETMVTPEDVDGVQTSQCFPSGPEAKDWPVKAIYLHGLFTKKGPDTSGFRKLEAANRKQLEELAIRMKIKIAIPVGDGAPKSNMRQWGNTSLKDIEAAAERACGGAELAVPRAMVGFSNGGFRTRDFANANCGTWRPYTKFLAIAVHMNRTVGPCGKGRLVYKIPHVFPDLDYLEGQLAEVRDASPFPKYKDNTPHDDGHH